LTAASSRVTAEGAGAVWPTAETLSAQNAATMMKTEWLVFAFMGSGLIRGVDTLPNDREVLGKMPGTTILGAGCTRL
jgi:hypothetical protein